MDMSDTLEWARSDFYVAVEVLIQVDARSHRLNEGVRPEWKDPDHGGEILYTKERMIELMGPEYNQRDYSKILEPGFGDGAAVGNTGPEHPSPPREP